MKGLIVQNDLECLPCSNIQSHLEWYHRQYLKKKKIYFL